MSERPNSGNNPDKTKNRRNKIVDDSFLFSLPYDKGECHQTYRKCCDRGLKITNKQSKKASGKVLLRNHQREGTEYGWRTIMIIGHSILLH